MALNTGKVNLDISIAVSVFGDSKWAMLAKNRAIPSANQFGVPVLFNDCDSLHESRNEALKQCETEYIVYLDADDQLSPDFLEEMSKGTCDLRAPSVTYIMPNGNRTRPTVPKVWNHTHNCVAACLPKGNWLVVGSVVKAQLLRDIGGWKDWPVYEDWDIWLICHLAGASIEAIPEAVYLAYAMPNSRNNSLPVHERDKIHYKILASVGL